MRRALRLLSLVATSALAVCGVKGPPRPPEAAQVQAAPVDAGAEAQPDAGPRP